MNIVLAQMKKDLVPLRGLLIGMAALIALTILGGVLDATGVVRSSGGNPLAGLQFLLIAILIVRLIHQDALTRPDAFWRTRPISRVHLLLAKSLFLILPALAYTAMAQPWSIGQGGTHDFLGSCMLLAGIAAFASVTGKFSEMLLQLFLVSLPVILIVMFIGLFGSVLLQLWTHFLGPLRPWTADPGRQWLSLAAAGLSFAGYLGIVVFQYLTARTRISLFAIGGVLLFNSVATSLAEHGAR